jgi:Flp pilus assembly protein CpaB
VVTLLTRPQDVDILAVADSAARVRLALRNPLDQEKPARGSLTLGTVIRGSTSKQR